MTGALEVLAVVGMMMVVALAVALIPLGLFALVYLSVDHRKRRLQVLRDVVRARGGKDTPSGLFQAPSGTFSLSGREVRLTFYSTGGDSPTLYTDFEVILPGRLPSLDLKPQGALSGIGKALGMQDIEVGDRSFDDAFLVQGMTRDAQALLTPEIRQHIQHIRGMHTGHLLHVRLAPAGQDTAVRIRKLRWIEEADALQAYIDACDALVSQLGARHIQPWQAAAQHHGLSLTTDGGLLQLEGTVDGIPVRAELRWKGGWVTTLRAARTRPEGLHIVHRDHGSGPEVSVENPVLGMMVHISGTDGAGVRALLADTTLTEELLAIVHGMPGSVVTQDAVLVQVRGRLWDRLPETIAQAARLAGMITAGQAQAGAESHRQPRLQPQRS